MLPLALTLSACDVEDNGDDLGDSSETGALSNTDEPVEETVLDEAPGVIVAEIDASNALGLCPMMYKCSTSGAWSSTSALCKANCAGKCTFQDFNNGHCIPR